MHTRVNLTIREQVACMSKREKERERERERKEKGEFQVESYTFSAS